MDLVFQNYKLEVELQAQSPLVHFQAEQVGATLRAPEVKSKLDSYIISCLMKTQKLNFDEFKKKNKDLFRDAGNHDALDYKMSIIDTEEPRYVQLGSRNNYMIFYANMGGGNWKGIISNPKITIMCFNKDLQKHICDNIDSFFNVYNFGFMQGKGFGSFSVKEKYKSKLSDNDKETIADGLKQVSGAEKCYYFEYNAVPNNDWNKMFDDIKLYYGIMKSGFNFRDNYSRSYLFQYMHEKGIDNEKAYMKQEKIAPAVNTHNRNNNNSTVTNPKYVRSLL